jgi:hypothetical protein
MRHLLRFTVLFAIAALLVTGCGRKHNQDQPEELPAARPLLDQSASYIQNARSFGLELAVSGYPVEINLNGLDVPSDTVLEFKYAKGVFQAPDRIDANIQFSLGDFTTSAELIALDREHYFRAEAFGNHWLSGELISGFSPASLLAQPGGIGHALQSISDLQMVGKIDLDGLPVFRLSGTIQASNVHSLTLGLIRTQEGLLKIEVYIQVKDQRVAQITLFDPPPADAQDQEETTWKISIMDYNQDVSITPPPTDKTEQS